MTGIKLEVGKTYLDRKGEKHGPLVHNLKEVGTLYEYSLGDRKFSASWRADGRVYNSEEAPLDLIEEVVEAETTMRNSPNWNDGTIHGWNGGDCPVHPETVVKYWTNSGEKYPYSAKCLRWKHTDEGLGDIIAFRVVKEYVEPKVIWANEYEDGYHTAHNTEEKAKHSARGLPSRIIRIAVKYVEAIADAKECKE